MPSGPFKNSLLRNLSSEALSRLALSPVTFKVEQEIEFPGSPIDHLYFVEEGMASQTTTFNDGSQVEVGMFGYEGVIGVSALMGTKRSLNRVYTQIAGSGYSCKVGAAKKEFSRGEHFHLLALNYVQAQLLGAMQSAGCNAKHDIDQRLARWLLLCADRTNSASFNLSQEFLAHMLGAGRPSVSVAAGKLQAEGLIRYNRSLIHILEPVRLEAHACECYRTIKRYLDNYTDFDSGMTS